MFLDQCCNMWENASTYNFLLNALRFRRLINERLTSETEKCSGKHDEKLTWNSIALIFVQYIVNKQYCQVTTRDDLLPVRLCRSAILQHFANFYTQLIPINPVFNSVSQTFLLNPSFNGSFLQLKNSSFKLSVASRPYRQVHSVLQLVNMTITLLSKQHLQFLQRRQTGKNLGR